MTPDLNPSAEDEPIRFFIFDIESVPDPTLVSLVRAGGSVEPSEALKEYREELVEKKRSDFIPYVYHQPVSLALAKVKGDLSINEIVVLKVEDGGPRRICERFWQGWRYYRMPLFVTFNGRGFDLPLMELTAYRYGFPLPEWFEDSGPSYNHPRNRYNKRYHLDLNSEFTNFGATTFDGGLNLASKSLRKAGKIETRGEMVQEMFEQGRLEEIHRYCRCDVLDTYFVFLRYCVLRGKITLKREQDLVEETRAFLKNSADDDPAYRDYLDAWDRVDEFARTHDYFARFESPKQ